MPVSPLPAQLPIGGPHPARRAVGVCLSARSDKEGRDVAAIPSVVLRDNTAHAPLCTQVHLHPACAAEAGTRRWRPRGRAVEHPHAAAARIASLARGRIENVVIGRPRGRHWR
eukprot:1870632-Prymnesium_polylepis.1